MSIRISPAACSNRASQDHHSRFTNHASRGRVRCTVITKYAVNINRIRMTNLSPDETTRYKRKYYFTLFIFSSARPAPRRTAPRKRKGACGVLSLCGRGSGSPETIGAASHAPVRCPRSWPWRVARTASRDRSPDAARVRSEPSLQSPRKPEVIPSDPAGR